MEESAEEHASAPLSILILNQAFYPDVVSTAQHASELASALVERGHTVSALSSARCYDNPKVEYRTAETRAGYPSKESGPADSVKRRAGAAPPISALTC